MVTFINRQRAHKINSKRWLEFANKALRLISAKEPDISIVFVSDAAIRKLNRDFRGRDSATDVLSFSTEAEPFERENRSQLGEIVISTQRAAAQAKQNGLTFTNEIEQLILHGFLHLHGYDHETDSGQMKRLELRLRKKLRI